MKKRFIDVFGVIDSLNLPDDSIWHRASNFFTMFIALYTYLIQKGNIDKTNLKERLEELEENILKNKGVGKDKNDFSKYYAYMYTGTNLRTARVVRAQIFSKYVLSGSEIF